jgi:hypothetical protein
LSHHGKSPRICQSEHSGNADENPDDDEDDSWLDELDLEVFPPEGSLDVSSESSIYLSSQHLAAALSEEPIGNITKSSQPNALGEPSELDDDFYMDL